MALTSYGLHVIFKEVRWIVEIGDEFEPEFDAWPEDGEWRVAFAFDPRRNAVLLIAGDKAGVGKSRFYRELIRRADERFDAHLARLRRKRK